MLVQLGATPVDNMEIVDVVDMKTSTGGGIIETVDHI